MPIDKTNYILTAADVWTYAVRKLSNDLATGRQAIANGAAYNVIPAANQGGLVSFATDALDTQQTVGLYDGANFEISGSAYTVVVTGDRDVSFVPLVISHGRYGRYLNNSGAGRTVSYVYMLVAMA